MPSPSISPDVLDPLFADGAAYESGLLAVHLYVQGRGTVERRVFPDTAIAVRSVSKTVTTLALGIAESAGALRRDEKVVDVLPDLADGMQPGAERITAWHLATMSAGIEEDNDVHLRAGAPGDYLAEYVHAPVVSPPGAAFAYKNGGFYTLARMIAKRTGQDVRDFLAGRLFAPLGVMNPQWDRCPAGYSLGYTGLHLRTIELARLGRLMLQRGEWDGKRLVPATFIDAMHADWLPTAHVVGAHEPESEFGYGASVWRCSIADAYRADGALGQFVVVMPSRQTVVTINSARELTQTDSPREILKDFFQQVLPNVPPPRGPAHA